MARKGPSAASSGHDKPTETQKKPPSGSPKSIQWFSVGLLLPILTYLVVQSQQLYPALKLPGQYFDALKTPNNTNSTLETLKEAYARQCPDHKYKTHLFSEDPLIVYIENYLTKDESQYLVNLGETKFSRSRVGGGANDVDSARSSQSAALPADDPVVRCVEARSLEYQGYLSLAQLELLQVVKYQVGEEFRPHFDWYSGMENPRISTFFVYLACDECEGGSTQFMDYRGIFSRRWCEFVDCEQTREEGRKVGGVGFKPIVGNAVFWLNLYPNGTGHQGVYHAGMPVTKGRKVGLNIWTRKEEIS